LQFDGKVAKVFYDLMKDSDIRNYILRNVLFELPKFGKELFIKDALNIFPSLQLYSL